MWLNFGFAILCLLGLSQAATITPDLPSEDDFYTAPGNITDYSEGDIINWRLAPLEIRSIYFPANVKNAWQFLVRSTDSRGNATAIVTTILEPYDADPSRLWSYQFAEDSASPDCAPSYSLLFGAKMDTIVLQFEMIFVQTGLSKGWFVVAPDYEGPRASFTAGRQAGHATLDSIRAALASSHVTGINSDAKVAMFGYSGGTVASGWAATLQPKYAPELITNLVGVALGGWVTNVTLTAAATDGGPFAGLIASAVNGLLQEYPEYGYLGSEQVIAKHYDKFETSKDMCIVNALEHFAFTSFFEGTNRYIEDGWAFFQIPAIVEIVNNNTLALYEDDGYPEIPVFVFHGEPDEVVPISGADRAYNNFCEWGINSLEFAVSNTTGHILEFVEGPPAAIKWIEDRFEGKDVVSGCQKTYRYTNLEYPGADLTLYELLSSAVDLVFGEKIGELANRNSTSIPKLTQKIESFLIKLIDKVGPIGFKK